jgi:hypothetical protein
MAPAGYAEVPMGFLDKAKAAANDLASKADTALSGAGMGGPGGGPAPDRLFRDLGVLAYLEASGRTAPAEERERLMAGLRDAEARGAIPSFALHTAAPPPGAVPPPPGAAAQAPPPPPPPGPATTPQPVSAPPAPDPVQPTAPPPPPPSWASSESKDESSG